MEQGRNQRSSVEIEAGSLPGLAYWDEARCSFAVTLRVFEHDGHDPPPTVTVGARTAEFPTTDSLVNHLTARGLAPTPRSVVALDDLGREAAANHGPIELVGVVAEASRHRLFLRLPSPHGSRSIEIWPRLDAADHRFHWGDSRPATVETARVLCELVWARRPNPDLDAFALALTHEYLASAPERFSLSALSLCDWFLTDEPLTTTIDPASWCAEDANP